MSKVPITPRSTKVLAEKAEAETQTATGFYIAKEGRKETSKATVIAVGSEVEGIKPKDTIYYTSFTEEPIKYGDIEYIFINEDDILGVLDA